MEGKGKEGIWTGTGKETRTERAARKVRTTTVKLPTPSVRKEPPAGGNGDIRLHRVVTRSDWLLADDRLVVIGASADSGALSSWMHQLRV